MAFKRKSIPKIILFLLLLILLYIGYGYSFFSCFIHMPDKDFRNVYSAVCKNTNITRQRIHRLTVDDDSVFVSLKLRALPYIFAKSDTDHIDFYSALNIYNELSENFPGRKIYVETGAAGSSKYTYCIDDRIFTFSKECGFDNNCDLGLYNIMVQVMNSSNINGVCFNWLSTHYTIDMINELPDNYSVSSLTCASAYKNNLSVMTSFKELLSLNITFVDNDSINCNDTADLSFLNHLNKLEHLIINADAERLDFSDVKNENVKNVKMKAENGSKASEDQLRSAFPNAKIEIG